MTHLSIRHDDGRVWIRDESSTGQVWIRDDSGTIGTVVDIHEIEKGKWVEVRPRITAAAGDRVIVGDYELEFVSKVPDSSLMAHLKSS